MKTWERILLLASVAFNLAFFGFFLYRVANPPVPPEFRHMKHMDGGRNSKMEQFTDGFQEELTPLRMQLREDRKAFITCLEADSLDINAAELARQRLLQSRAALEDRISVNLLQYRQKSGKRGFNELKSCFPPPNPND